MPAASKRKRRLKAHEVAAVAKRVCAPGRLNVIDKHTHLFSPNANLSAFRGGKAKPKPLCLYGVVESLLYHYVLRSALALEVVTPDEVTKSEADPKLRTDLARRIWERMFRKRRGATDDVIFVGVDEGCTGVKVALEALGFNPEAETLDEILEQEAKTDPNELLDRAMKIAGVSKIVGTNTFTDDDEREYYLACQASGTQDSRFLNAMRLDPITLHFATRGGPKLRSLGFNVDPADHKSSKAELLRYMDHVEAVLGGTLYVASSFAPADNPADPDTPTGWIMNEVVLPWCAKNKKGFFAMPGPERAENAAWGNAGDGMGFCEFAPYRKLVRDWRDVKFMLTVLHEGNQPDGMVMACNAGNVENVGHWWFNLTPVRVKALVLARMQLLATRFTAFNSDARVIENLISKWVRFRMILEQVLTEIFMERIAMKIHTTEEEIEDCARALFQLAA